MLVGSGVLKAALSPTIPLTIPTENAYATGDVFDHVLAVEVPAPTTDDLDDRALDTLILFTGEGPRYSSAPAIDEVQILGITELRTQRGDTGLPGR
ncbi:hypothetical protein [Gordonia sp. FQ]|uniref:hypothetical protein n=1 Tax=Gordonia sp. FQ TaxID=3446634 RepID=UPI003F8393B2